MQEETTPLDLDLHVVDYKSRAIPAGIVFAILGLVATVFGFLIFFGTDQTMAFFTASMLIDLVSAAALFGITILAARAMEYLALQRNRIYYLLCILLGGLCLAIPVLVGTMVAIGSSAANDMIRLSGSLLWFALGLFMAVGGIPAGVLGLLLGRYMHVCVFRWRRKQAAKQQD